jgi:DNA invertase Pin-like site-specific DNA recombinase
MVRIAQGATSCSAAGSALCSCALPTRSAHTARGQARPLLSLRAGLPEHCLNTVHALKERRVSFFLLDLAGGSDDLSGKWQSQFFLNVLAAVADFERERIGERIRLIKRAQKDRGEFTGGPPPFGFRHDEQKNLVTIPEQQEAIRQMRRLKAKGHSLRAIAAT